MLSAQETQGQEPVNQAVTDLIHKLLVEPFDELKARPSHKFRSRLVEIGVSLAGPALAVNQRNLRICSDAIEALHLGSLIVDDIQDGSATRRNGAALHAKLGVPHALSVGNWLYFKAMKSLIELNLSDAVMIKLQKEWLNAIESAHYGQAMDLATNVKDLPIEDISEICHYTSLYKTGCITGLAIAMGAIIAGANDERVARVRELGCALGIYLQQFNDLGNLIGDFDEDKRYEDLKTCKPSYIWSLTLEHFGEAAFQELLVACGKLPDDKAMGDWLTRYPVRALAQISASKAFGKTIDSFQERYPDTDLSAILTLRDRIQKAYA